MRRAVYAKPWSYLFIVYSHLFIISPLFLYYFVCIYIHINKYNYSKLTQTKEIKCKFYSWNTSPAKLRMTQSLWAFLHNPSPSVQKYKLDKNKNAPNLSMKLEGKKHHYLYVLQGLQHKGVALSYTKSRWSRSFFCASEIREAVHIAHAYLPWTHTHNSEALKSSAVDGDNKHTIAANECLFGGSIGRREYVNFCTLDKCW